MITSTKLLISAIALLMIDSIMELAFISSMVAWLHVRAGQGFLLQGGPNGSFLIRGKPKRLLLDQGHASNGAAGTAFIAIGLGGILILWLRNRALKHHGRMDGAFRFLYSFWLTLTVLSALYSLGCFIAVTAITYAHSDQNIDVAYASELFYSPYYRKQWTPQGWFAALLRVGFADPSTRSDVKLHLAVMRGWEWNLIPMTILGFVVMALAFRDRTRHAQKASSVEYKLDALNQAEDAERSSS